MEEKYQKTGLLNSIREWVHNSGMLEPDFWDSYKPKILSDIPSHRDLLLRDTGKIDLDIA